MTRAASVQHGIGCRDWREINHGGLHGNDLRT
jgi:hypothetical protein